MSIKKNSFKEHLRKSSRRATEQRFLILEAIKKLKKHFSVNDVYLYLKTKGNTVSLPTVYRNIKLFKEMNMVREVDLGKEWKMYELFTEHHYHIICKRCGKIEEIDDPLTENLEEKVKDKTNYKIIGYHLEFYGYCARCWEEKNAEEIDRKP